MEAFLKRSPVIPVVTIEDATVAPQLAQALARGGITVMEVTLRTSAALSAIEAIAKHVPEVAVGAGTVLAVEDLTAASNAGARFAISPGMTRELLDAARKLRIPYLPGIATASELMQGLAAGLRCFKFFPAGSLGGVTTLRALGAPFPAAGFCPTGGVTLDNARQYLALENVLCVGGSWLTPQDVLRAHDWAHVEGLARQAVERLCVQSQR